MSLKFLDIFLYLRMVSIHGKKGSMDSMQKKWLQTLIRHNFGKLRWLESCINLQTFSFGCCKSSRSDKIIEGTRRCDPNPVTFLYLKCRTDTPGFELPKCNYEGTHVYNV